MKLMAAPLFLTCFVAFESLFASVCAKFNISVPTNTTALPNSSNGSAVTPLVTSSAPGWSDRAVMGFVALATFVFAALLA
jgi:hypothetical protein